MVIQDWVVIDGVALGIGIWLAIILVATAFGRAAALGDRQAREFERERRRQRAIERRLHGNNHTRRNGRCCTADFAGYCAGQWSVRGALRRSERWECPPCEWQGNVHSIADREADHHTRRPSQSFETLSLLGHTFIPAKRFDTQIPRLNPRFGVRADLGEAGVCAGCHSLHPVTAGAWTGNERCCFYCFDSTVSQ